MGGMPVRVVQDPSPTFAMEKGSVPVRHDHLVPSGFFQWTDALRTSLGSVQQPSNARGASASFRQRAHKLPWDDAAVLSVREQLLPSALWSTLDTSAATRTLRH